MVGNFDGLNIKIKPNNCRDLIGPHHQTKPAKRIWNLYWGLRQKSRTRRKCACQCSIVVSTPVDHFGYQECASSCWSLIVTKWIHLVIDSTSGGKNTLIFLRKVVCDVARRKQCYWVVRETISATNAVVCNIWKIQTKISRPLRFGISSSRPQPQRFFAVNPSKCITFARQKSKFALTNRFPSFWAAPKSVFCRGVMSTKNDKNEKIPFLQQYSVRDEKWTFCPFCKMPCK